MTTEAIIIAFAKAGWTLTVDLYREQVTAWLVAPDGEKYGMGILDKPGQFDLVMECAQELLPAG